MQTVSEYMTPEVAVVTPTDTLQLAARRMKDWDIGALPVLNHNMELVGIVSLGDLAKLNEADLLEQ